MPLNIPPELLEITRFSGWQPDLEPGSLPEGALSDALNLLPDRDTGTLETREGYRRFSAFNVAGYTAKALHTYDIGYGSTDELGTQFLIGVIGNGTSTADNVQVHRVNVQDGTTARIDDTGRIWKHVAAAHWNATIDNTLFGGSELDPIYSYRPYFSDGHTVNPDPWDPDASMPQYAVDWANATAYAVGDRVHTSVTFTNELGKQKTLDAIWIATTAHTSSDLNKPGGKHPGKNAGDFWEFSASYKPLWDSAAHSYSVGDVVTYLVTGNQDFPRGIASRSRNTRSAFVCVHAHTSDANKAPVSTGGGWTGAGLWEPARGPVSNVAIYHGARLFMRDSNAGTGRIRYSQQVKADGLFDITDWSATDVQGAGELDVRSGDGDDVRALGELGNYLVICKRRSTHVLAGINPATWALRQVSDKGCLYKRAIVQHEGLAYFFGDQGFMASDGTTVQEAPGAEVFRDWIRTNLDLENNNVYRIAMTSFKGYVLLSFPLNQSSVPNYTIAYDPATQSLWPLGFGTRQFAINRVNRIDELFFISTGAPALIFQYAKSDANNADDTGAASYAATPVNWRLRTGWFTFGSSREDRKIRRIWAMMRAPLVNVTMSAYRNFVEAPAWTLTRAMSANPVSYFEGQIMPDSWAMSFKVEGDAAPSSFMGLSIQTIFRRKRYHRS